MLHAACLFNCIRGGALVPLSPSRASQLFLKGAGQPNIVLKRLAEISPYENNPRKNDEAVKYVAESIKNFGFKQPIVVDRNNTIVAGHTRYKAAKKLNLKEVPCIVADDLTEEQVKAFRLADNKVAEKAEWDFDLLFGELDDICDFDMSDFGFVIADDLEVNDEDFLQDTEITKEKKPKEVTCPHCGEVFQL